MIYKRYELSQSLNGDVIVYIARNAAGMVVFREPSEKELKKAIDESEAEIVRLSEIEAQKRTEKEKRKKKKTPPKPTEEEEDGETEEASEEPEKESAVVPPQTRVTRGQDGKFIGRSALQEEEPKKKSFWDNLK